MVIVFEDFVRDPKTTYDAVLKYIDAPSDGRESFPQVNMAKVQRSRLLGHNSSSMPRWLFNVAREVKILVSGNSYDLIFLP